MAPSLQGSARSGLTLDALDTPFPDTLLPLDNHSAPPDPPPNRRELWILLAALVCGLVVPVILTAPSLVQGYRDARGGQAAVELAGRSVLAGEAERAQEALDDARAAFVSAEGHLSAFWTAPARLLPGLGRQISTAHHLAETGAALTAGVTDLVHVASPEEVSSWIRDGQVDIGALRDAAAATGRAEAAIAEATAALDASSASLLVPPLAAARAEAEERIEEAAGAVRKAAIALEVAPHLIAGEGEPRRYLVLYSNLAEIRGAGGHYGFFTMLEAGAGRISLGDNGRPTHELPPIDASAAPEWFRRSWERHGALDLWSNLNLSPDFPTVAGIAARSTGVDGVIQIDPIGIAALLRATGPLSLDTWDKGEITADNVSDVTHAQIYLRYLDRADRDAFGAELLSTTLTRLLEADFADAPKAMPAIGSAIAAGHIRVYADGFADDLETLGLARGVEPRPAASDVVGVYNLNADASKQDSFLRREMTYKVFLDPDTGSARTSLTVDIDDATPDDMPDYVTGRGLAEVAPEDNRTMVLFTRPPQTKLRRVVARGDELDVSDDREAGLRSHATTVVVPADGSVRLRLSSAVPEAIIGEGDVRTYRLVVPRQASIQPDRVRIEVAAPGGWILDERRWEGTLTEDLVFEVELRRDRLSRLGSAVLEPLRTLGSRLLGRR